MFLFSECNGEKGSHFISMRSKFYSSVTLKQCFYTEHMLFYCMHELCSCDSHDYVLQIQKLCVVSKVSYGGLPANIFKFVSLRGLKLVLCVSGV